MSEKQTLYVNAYRSLGGKDPLEEGMMTHSSIVAWRSPWTEEPAGYTPEGLKVSLTRLKQPSMLACET